MPPKIYLTAPVMYFRATGQQLIRAGFIDEGSHFFVGTPRKMIYDHCEQLTVPFKKDDEEFFLLAKELNDEQRKELGAGTVSA